MKKWMVLLVAGVLAVGAASAWAGGSCCGKKKEKASCIEKMGDLNLSDEQKAKIAEIESACKAEGCSKESCAKSKSQIRDVLTADQQEKWDEICGAKASGGGCGSKS